MKKTLNLPLVVQWVQSTSNNTYTLVQSEKEDFITAIGLDENLGEVYENTNFKKTMIDLIERGKVAVLAAPSQGAITEEREAYSADISSISLRIETDASPLTNALIEANAQASALEATLERIRSMFSK